MESYSLSLTLLMTGLTQPASTPATMAAPICFHWAGVVVPRATPCTLASGAIRCLPGISESLTQTRHGAYLGLMLTDPRHPTIITRAPGWIIWMSWPRLMLARCSMMTSKPAPRWSTIFLS